MVLPWRQIWLRLAALGLVFSMAAPRAAGADGGTGAPPASPPTGEAWWTGPMLANSAATLPRGHILIEPYVYDATTSRTNSLGSSAYLLYGFTDRLTVGLIPVIGFHRVGDGPSSSRLGLGDVSPLFQVRLTRPHPGSSAPTVAFEVQETLPTGKYDRLGKRPSDGLGAGPHDDPVDERAVVFGLPNSGPCAFVSTFPGLLRRRERARRERLRHRAASVDAPGPVGHFWWTQLGSTACRAAGFWRSACSTATASDPRRWPQRARSAERPRVDPPRLRRAASIRPCRQPSVQLDAEPRRAGRRAGAAGARHASPSITPAITVSFVR